jgi:hypothetical protein
MLVVLAYCWIVVACLHWELDAAVDSELLIHNGT